MRLKNIEIRKMLQPLLFRKIGECSKLSGNSTTKGELLWKLKEFGEDILAVANSWLQSNQNNNTNKVNSLMNKQKLSRNTIEGSIAENMSMTFMQGRATYSMSKARMRKLENSSKILQEKLLSKRQNFRSKLQGQNSMSSLLIFIILRQQKLSLEYTTLHIHS